MAFSRCPPCVHSRGRTVKPSAVDTSAVVRTHLLELSPRVMYPSSKGGVCCSSSSSLVSIQVRTQSITWCTYILVRWHESRTWQRVTIAVETPAGQTARCMPTSSIVRPWGTTSESSKTLEPAKTAWLYDPSRGPPGAPAHSRRSSVLVSTVAGNFLLLFPSLSLVHLSSLLCTDLGAPGDPKTTTAHPAGTESTIG